MGICGRIPGSCHGDAGAVSCARGAQSRAWGARRQPGFAGDGAEGGEPCSGVLTSRQAEVRTQDLGICNGANEYCVYTYTLYIYIYIYILYLFIFVFIL